MCRGHVKTTARMVARNSNVGFDVEIELIPETGGAFGAEISLGEKSVVKIEYQPIKIQYANVRVWEVGELFRSVNGFYSNCKFPKK